MYNSVFNEMVKLNRTDNSTSYILDRRSIRRFKPEGVADQLMGEFLNAANLVHKLVDENQFFLRKTDYEKQTDHSKALGGFGRLMQPPHFFIPYLIGQTWALTDLGFRSQQIVLQMWHKGIGSCYIGCVHRQGRVRQLLGLPAEAHISALVVFGIPDYSRPERLYRKISHLFARSQQRLPMADLFLDASWREMDAAGDGLRQIVEAGRFAPSAVNAQPWRFRISDNRFAMYARFDHLKKVYDFHQEYPLHDAGLCMANMSMAAQAQGFTLQWQLADEIREETINGQRVIQIADFPINGLR